MRQASTTRRVLVRTTAGLALVVVAGWLLAAGGVGMGFVVPRVLARTAPEGWTVTVGSVRGDWRSAMELSDLRIEAPGLQASLPSLRIRYRLRPLLGRAVEISAVDIEEPTLSLARDADAREGAGDDPDGSTALASLTRSPLGRWSARVNGLRVSGASARVELAHGVYEVRHGAATGRAELGPDGVRFEVDSLSADLVPPGDGSDRGAESDLLVARLGVAATLDDGVLEVRALSLRSQRSDVSAAGRVALAPVQTGSEAAGRFDFDFEARPLHLGDLPLDLPEAMARDPLVEARLSARGTLDSVQVEARATALTTTMVEGEGTVLRTSGASPVIDLSARLTHDPDSVATGALAHPLSAELRLEGLRRRDGTEAAPSESAGPWTPDSATVAVRRRDDGTAVRAVLAAIEGGVSWRLDARIDSGSVGGSGTLTYAAEPLVLTVRRLDFERLDLSSLSPRAPVTSLVGSARGRTAGRSLEASTGTIDLSLGSSTVGGTLLDTLAVSATLDAGTARGRLFARDSTRQVETSYEARLTGAALEGRLRGAHLTAATDSVAIEAWWEGSGRWVRTASPRTASFDIAVDSVSRGGDVARRGHLRGTLRGDSLSLDASVGDGRVASRPLSLEASLIAVGTTLDSIRGTLTVTGVVSRRPPAVGSSTSGAEAPGAAIHAAPSDTIAVTVVAGAPGAALALRGRVRPGSGGRLDLTGSFSRGLLAPARTGRFDLAARGTLSGPLASLDDMSIDSVTLDVEGEVASGEAAEVDGRLLLRGGRWRDLTADTVWVVARRDANRMLVDTVRIVSNVLIADGGGFVAPGVDSTGFTLRGELLDPGPLGSLLGARVVTADGGEVTLSVLGTGGGVRLRGTADVTALAGERLRVGGLQLEAEALLEPPYGVRMGLRDADARLRLDRLLLPDAEIGGIEARLRGGLDSLTLEASAQVDEGRQAEILVQIDPRPERRTARIDRLDLRLEADRWRLAEPAVLSYRDGYAFRSFELRRGESRIVVDGTVSRDGGLDVALDMDSTDVGTVSDLFGLPGLDGWLAGSARLTGTTDAPEGRLDLEGAFHRTGGTPGPARISLASDGGRVTTDVELGDPAGGRLAATGSVRLRSASRPDSSGSDALDLTVRATRFSLAWALPFVDPRLVSGLEGSLDGSLTIRGTEERPELGGTLVMSGGRARVLPLGVTFEDAVVALRGEGRSVAIDSARVRSSSGTVEVTGTVTPFDDMPIDLDVTLRSFRAIANEAYGATVSGRLRAAGGVRAPVVDGTLDVERLDVYLDERVTGQGLEDIELTDEDLAMLRQRFGYVPDDDARASTPLAERLTADLEVRLGRDSWIRKEASPEMAVPFTGDLTVELRPGRPPRLLGAVETIAGRGFIEQFGRRFTVGEGTVTFDGPPDQARFDLSASYTIPSRDNPDDAEATIVLDVIGTRDALGLELSAEPQMENADIVSYIATGRPASGSLTFEGDDSEGGLVSAGANLALGQIVGAVEGAAARQVGLDVVEIRREGFRQATLVAGKYVSPRLYVGFAQPITLGGGDGLSLGGENDSEVEIELAALRWLLVNIEGSSSALRFFLRGRYAY